MADDIELGGWRIGAGFADAPGSRHFYAVYGGDAFGAAARGIIAVMARAHAPGGAHQAGAREAAQLVVHSFAEGYFGAPKTLGAKRAASLSLHSINNWLFSQLRNDTARHLTPVSLTALLFSGGRLGVVHVGSCRLYRDRAGEVVPLAHDHQPRYSAAPSRAVGHELELSVDYSEEAVAAGDRFLLISGLPNERAAVLRAAFGLDLAAVGGRPGDTALMVLDVHAAPPADAALPSALANLPIRAAPREGEQWDGFIIGKTLYQGRYTMLKAAYDSIGKREVALKIPLRAMLQDQVFAAGFMREAWIGGTVRGTNVAQYIDLPAARRSSLYLVLPLYKGETLEARLHRGPVVSLPDGIGIALKLCEAVQDLAAIQIIHRDIKPENIMLLPGNEIKLLDLGLAYLPGIDQAEIAKPGGTLRYMAPELLQGVPASASSEVYALAVTVYRLFSGGAYPFGQREAVPLARLRPDLPAWLGLILQRALLADPAGRYADAGALALALHEALVSGGDTAPRPRRGLTPLQAWRAAALLLAALCLVLLLRALR